MKLILVVALFVATATASFIDDLKPRHIVPSIPHIPLNQLLQSRITNGEVAGPKQFPHQVALILGFFDGYAFCGGTLISSGCVLTAGHCVDAANNVTVILGTTNLNILEPGGQTIFVNKSGLIVHENWQSQFIRNDIGLINLPIKVAFTSHIQPAKLPKKTGSSDDLYVGDIATASGWGRVSDTSTTISPVLRYIESKVISNSACSRYYPGYIWDTNICITGEDRRSTCNGDSGGPLTLKKNGKNIVIGITSFGSSAGCEVGYAAVFTRTSKYVTWIETKTGIVNN